MKKQLLLLPSLLLVAGLSSCSMYDLFSNSSSASVKTSLSGDNWYTATDLTSKITYKNINNSGMTDSLITSGSTTLLVLPIEFTDYPFSSSFMTDLDTVLNGAADDTGYWESVSSFYEKSSFGKVDLSFRIADSYNTDLTARGAHSSYGNSSDYGRTLIEKAYENYCASNSTSGLDSDGNGFLDGIIAVYSCPDVSTGGFTWDYKTSFYWAYTYWFSGYSADQSTYIGPNYTKPTPNAYIWLSYDFMYDATTSPNVDAHTFIHEMGHMFGLDDYYDSEGNCPAGGISMGDYNIMDYDIWSKIALGWANPKVPAGDCTIEIEPSQTSGDCILLPLDSWNGSVWDEYLVLELYTPTGLNYQDSHVTYANGYRGPSSPGIRIFHVDARIVGVKMSVDSFNQYSYTGSYLTDLDDFSINWYGDTFYMVGASNINKDSDIAPESFDLINMIDASGINIYSNGGYATNSSLFKAGSSFTMDKFGRRFFPNQTTMNNGEEFPWKISIDSVSDTSATVSITAV